MEMKTVGVTIAVFVSLVVLAAVLMPVLDDATATEDTFTNDGYFYLDKFEDDYTFYWDAADPTTFTINGEDMTFTNDSGLDVSLVLGKNFAVRFPSAGNKINFYGAGTFVSTSAEYPTFTLTYSSGAVTVTNGNASKTVSSVTEVFGIVEKGDYVMKKSTSVAYLNSGSEIVADSEIYASGQTYNGANYIWWHLEGSIDDMEYPDTFNNNITVSNQEINGAYNSSHEDLYELSNLKFTAVQSGVTYNVTASYFVVPAEVTAERSVHFTDNENAIFAAIPLLVIVALLIGVLAVVIRSKSE